MKKDLQQIENRTRVLRKILEKEEISQSALAGELGIDLSAVSVLVDNLLAGEWIVETDSKPDRTATGRKDLSLSINGRKGVVLGLSVRRSNSYDLIITDLRGEILFSESGHYTPPEEGNDYTYLLNELIDNDFYRDKKILGMGISLPGLIDTGAQRIIDSKAPVLKDVLVSQLVSEQHLFPVLVENDSRCCAWGKAWKDHRFALSTFVYLYMTGNFDLAMGLYVDGDILYGANNHSGEFSKGFLDKAKKRMKGLVGEIAASPDNISESSQRKINVLIEEFLDMIYILDPDYLYLGYEFEGFEDIFTTYLNRNHLENSISIALSGMGPAESAYGAACFFLNQLFRAPEVVT